MLKQSTTYFQMLFCMYICSSWAWSQEVESTVKGPKGLAAKYPGDQGIEKNGRVIFTENFETSDMPTIIKRWESVKDNGQLSFSADVPPSSRGKQSLLVRHVGGKGTGAHLYRRLQPGYNQLYLRFYVKFDLDCYPIHHFVHLGGYYPATPWPQGGAGDRPAGHERFTTGVEPFGQAWRWDFYSYWMEMRGNPSKRFWGNDFINDKNLEVVRGEWICVELMMKLNDPTTADNGEQALWINGKPWRTDGQTISHFKPGQPKGKWVWDSFHPHPDGKAFSGFRWRKDEKLKLNFLWLLVYITKAPPGHLSQIQFDDIVVARDYIGSLIPVRK